MHKRLEENSMRAGKNEGHHLQVREAIAGAEGCPRLIFLFGDGLGVSRAEIISDDTSAPASVCPKSSTTEMGDPLFIVILF